MTTPPSAPPRPSGPTGATGATAATRNRFLRRRRARRRVMWRRLLVLLAGVAAVVGGVWLLFFSSVFAVSGAEVRGTDVLSAAQVEEAAAVPLGVPLVTADLDAVQARVEALPAVREVQVSRSWPDAVRIEVTEREAVAVVSWEGRWRGVDRDGVLFRDYPGRPEELLEVTMRSSTPADALAEAAVVVDSLPGELLERVESVHVVSIDSITLRLRGGAQVSWGSAEHSADKVEVLRLLLQRKARVYDVTAPGRPTIRG